MNIYLNKISFAYADSSILNNISIRLNTGKFVCLLGRNGSGKTTLMQIASGRLAPTSGEIRYSETDNPIRNHKTLKRHFSILPQGIQDPPYLKVREILALAQYNPKTQSLFIFEVNDKQAIVSAMTSCEIENFADRPFNELSGGEKQRVWLAFCLIQNKPFMMLDESLHALDFTSKDQAFRLLATLASKGKGILLSTHDLALAEKYADQIIHLEGGRITYDGPSGA
jgi:iron complex transport system ATP-binding protein